MTGHGAGQGAGQAAGHGGQGSGVLCVAPRGSDFLQLFDRQVDYDVD